MKKAISLFLFITLIFSFSFTAYAEEDLLNYRWRDVEKIVQESFGADGNIWPIDEVNVTMWLPGEYSSVDPAAEGLDNDCIRLFVSSVGSGYVIITYSDADGVDLENYYNYSLGQGVSSYKILVNDIPAVEQDREDSFMLTFSTQEGKFLQFLFGPSSNPVYGLVMSSIMSTVEEEPLPIEPESVEVPATPTPENPVSRLISK